MHLQTLVMWCYLANGIIKIHFRIVQPAPYFPPPQDIAKPMRKCVRVRNLLGDFCNLNGRNQCVIITNLVIIIVWQNLEKDPYRKTALSFFIFTLVRSVCYCVLQSLAQGEVLLWNPVCWRVPIVITISTLINPNILDNTKLSSL